MPDPLERYLPDTPAGMLFTFLTLLLVVVPVTVVLASREPWLLGLLAGLTFLGWVLVATGLVPTASDDEETTEDVDPLATLQDEYARGAIDDAEFERRLERLAETGALDRDDVRRVERSAGRDGRRETGRERERER